MIPTRARRWARAHPLVVVGVVTGLAVLASSCGHAQGAGGRSPSSTGQDVAMHAHRLGTPSPRPSFRLTDTAGRPFAFAARTAGHPTFLYFGYTHCPDACPETMANLGAALRGVPAAIRRAVRVVFVTTDPKRDTGSVLRSWLSHFDAGLPVPFVGLTGTQAQLAVAQRLAGVPLAQDNGQQHSTQTLFYGQDNVARVFYQPGDAPAGIGADLKAVVTTKG